MQCNVEQDEDGWCPECGGHTDVIVDKGRHGKGSGGDDAGEQGQTKSEPQVKIICCTLL
jgi:ribosomal protein L44E